MKKIGLVIVLLLVFNLNVLALNQKIPVALSKCVDGDTAKFILNEEIITVRFLAIDTPESVDKDKEVEPYSLEASDYTCNKLTNATKIEILYDDNANKDKYSRTLAWVFIDNELLNDLIIKNGYGKVAYLYGDYLYTDTLKSSEKLAQKEKLGIWHDYEESHYETYLIIIITITLTLMIIFKKTDYKNLEKLLKYLKQIKR